MKDSPWIAQDREEFQPMAVSPNRSHVWIYGWLQHAFFELLHMWPLECWDLWPCQSIYLPHHTWKNVNKQNHHFTDTLLVHDPQCNPIWEIHWKVRHEFLNVFSLVNFFQCEAKLSEVCPESVAQQLDVRGYDQGRLEESHRRYSVCVPLTMMCSEAFFRLPFSWAWSTFAFFVRFAWFTEVMAVAFCVTVLNVNGWHIRLNFFLSVLFNSLDTDARRFGQVFKCSSNFVHHIYSAREERCLIISWWLETDRNSIYKLASCPWACSSQTKPCPGRSWSFWSCPFLARPWRRTERSRLRTFQCKSIHIAGTWFKADRAP